MLGVEKLSDRGRNNKTYRTKRRRSLRKQFGVNWIRRPCASSLNHLFNSLTLYFPGTYATSLSSYRSRWLPTHVSLVRNLLASLGVAPANSFFLRHTAAVQISRKVGSDGGSNGEILRGAERKSRSCYRAMWIKMSETSDPDNAELSLCAISFNKVFYQISEEFSILICWFYSVIYIINYLH